MLRKLSFAAFALACSCASEQDAFIEEHAACDAATTCVPVERNCCELVAIDQAARDEFHRRFPCETACKHHQDYAAVCEAGRCTIAR